MFDFIFGISLNAVVSGDTLDYQEPVSLHLKVQHEASPLYAWGSYGQGDFFVLGQQVASNQAFSVGLGVTHDITDKLSVFAEVGQTFHKIKPSMIIQQEVAYTYLVNRHAVESRPIPVTTNYPYDQESYSTTYEVDDSTVGKIGLNFEISDRWSTSVAYRFSKTETLIEIYDEVNRAAGYGYWMEEATTDLSAFEFQVLFRF